MSWNIVLIFLTFEGVFLKILGNFFYIFVVFNYAISIFMESCSKCSSQIGNIDSKGKKQKKKKTKKQKQNKKQRKKMFPPGIELLTIRSTA